MDIALIEFSPTGGTDKVARALAGHLGRIAQEVDLCDRTVDFASVTFDMRSLAVIAVPSFAGRVPALAAERIALLDGNGTKAVIVAVYGGRAYDDTLIELEDVCKAAGFSPIAALAALAQHSILPQYAADRPDEQDLMFFEQAASAIRAKLDSGGFEPLKVPGNRPYKKAGSATLVPKTSKACTRCGLCASNCPSGAIDPSDFAKTDKTLCIGCMRCVRECPEQARSVSAIMTKIASLAIKKECEQLRSPELFGC